MKLYKLTDKHDKTYGGTQWGEGISHDAPGEGQLCTSGWIHAYTDPILAVLMNPIHASFKTPHLWEAEADEIGKTDRGLKVGVKHLTTIRRIPLRHLNLQQRVKFAILCVKAVGQESAAWNAWADRWLAGDDRSEDAAAYATSAAYAMSAVYASRAAADAAAYATSAAYAMSAVYAAAYAADAAKVGSIDFIALAHEAIR